MWLISDDSFISTEKLNPDERFTMVSIQIKIYIIWNINSATLALRTMKA